MDKNWIDNLKKLDKFWVSCYFFIKWENQVIRPFYFDQ